QLFDYIKGELVVSIEEDSDNKSIQSTDKLIRESAQLEKIGFQIVDSLLASEQSDSQFMSDDFKWDVVDHMWLFYLVACSCEKYEDFEKAKEELEIALEDLGLKVRYIQGNYTMQAIEKAPEDFSPAMHPNQRWHYDMIKAP